MPGTVMADMVPVYVRHITSKGRAGLDDTGDYLNPDAIKRSIDSAYAASVEVENTVYVGDTTHNVVHITTKAAMDRLALDHDLDDLEEEAYDETVGDWDAQDALTQIAGDFGLDIIRVTRKRKPMPARFKTISSAEMRAKQGLPEMREVRGIAGRELYNFAAAEAQAVVHNDGLHMNDWFNVPGIQGGAYAAPQAPEFGFGFGEIPYPEENPALEMVDIDVNYEAANAIILDDDD